MWDAWAAGDRKGALAAIPDEVVDDLVVHGSPEECRAHVQRYVDNGVTIPAPMVIPIGVSLEDAVAGLAPSAGEAEEHEPMSEIDFRTTSLEHLARSVPPAGDLVEGADRGGPGAHRAARPALQRVRRRGR